MNCFGCSAPLTDALILSCEHNLCLNCAAQQLAGSDMDCRVCGRVTAIDEDSCEQLREIKMRPLFTTAHGFFGTPSRAATPVHRTPLATTSSVPFSPARSATATPSSRRLNLSGYPAISAALERSRPSVQSLCGQCDRKEAAVRCSQCREDFCADCSASIHARGRLATHELEALTRRPNTVAVQRQTNNFPLPPRLAFPTPTATSATPRVVRTGQPCESHPEEPVQYFCLVCESRPICAECVFRGTRHHSHLSEVLPLRKALPALRAKIEAVHAAAESASREAGNSKRELEDGCGNLANLGEQAKAQMKRGFEELREQLRVREVELCRAVDDAVLLGSRQMQSEIENLTSKQQRLEDAAVALAGAVSAGDDLGSLAAYADAKEAAKEAAGMVWPKVPKMQIPADSAMKHTEAVNTLHSALADLPGLLPSGRPATRAESVRENARVENTRREVKQQPVATNGRRVGDSSLMKAVAAAFDEPLSPDNLSVLSRGVY